MQNNDPPQGVRVPVPGLVNMLTYMAKKDLAAVTKLRILRRNLAWRVHCAHSGPRNGAGGGSGGVRADMKMDAGVRALQPRATGRWPLPGPREAGERFLS